MDAFTSRSIIPLGVFVVVFLAILGQGAAANTKAWEVLVAYTALVVCLRWLRTRRPA